MPQHEQSEWEKEFENYFKGILLGENETANAINRGHLEEFFTNILSSIQRELMEKAVVRLNDYVVLEDDIASIFRKYGISSNEE